MQDTSFPFTQQFVDTGVTYAAYRDSIRDMLAVPATDAAAQKMRPYIEYNSDTMDRYDASCLLSTDLLSALKKAPPTQWIVITEGWCGDASFSLPVFAAIEKAAAGKVQLCIFLRDTNPELIDAYLTDGGRGIPKVVVLNDQLQELGNWGPRPQPLHELAKEWRTEGADLKTLILNVRSWYNADNTTTVQQELLALIRAYS